MTDHRNQLRESLSAMVDGEASELEIHRILKQSSEDQSIAESWYRFHLVSHSIKGELPVQFADLSGAISAAIAQEATHSTASGGRFAKLWKPAGRVAVAASVAVMAVFGINQWQTAQQPDAAMIAAAGGSEAAQAPSELRPAVTPQIVNWGALNPQVDNSPVLRVYEKQPEAYSEEEVKAYLLDLMRRHTNHAVTESSQGMMTYGRMPTVQEAQQ